MHELQNDLATLQGHLDQLIDCIRENDDKQSRFQALESRLLAITSLQELVSQTLNGTRETFDLEDVGLSLVDESRQMGLILREDGMLQGDLPGLNILERSADLLASLGADMTRPHLGLCAPEADSNQTAAGEVGGSFVLLPLVRRGQLLGCLNMVSSDPGRFKPGMATDFLERLSLILSVCLENTVNFELLRRASLRDMLTGVNNRRFFDQRLDEEINRVMRSGECLSCLFLDIDFFKKINDTFGHQAGDMALVAVAHCVRSQLRNNDVLARYGGEEFVALLAVSSVDGAIEVAERIRSKVEAAEIRHPSGRPIPVTLSVGVATLDPGCIRERSGFASGHLIGLADRALYQAKASGRNCVVNGGLVTDTGGDMLPPRQPARRQRARVEKAVEPSPQVSFNW